MCVLKKPVPNIFWNSITFPIQQSIKCCLTSFKKKPKKASVDHVILASGTFLLFLHGGIWIATTEHPHFRQSMTGLYCALVNAGGQLLGDSEDDDVKED